MRILSKKIKVNNKPIEKVEREKEKAKKKRKEKFKDISIEALMDYVEKLETRIMTLEEKVNKENQKKETS